MAAEPTSVLVIGATGALGRPVVRRLRQRGVAVRAACRHPDLAADLAALGAELMVADLTRPATLASACQGMQRVLAAAHGLLGRGRWRSEQVDDAGHRALIQAARAAGVRRFVYTSAFGARPDHPVDFFRTKHHIEQALAASGLDAVVLRPTAFMEQHVHLFNGQAVLAKGKASLVGPGTKPRNFVCAEDVAELAVQALLADPPPFRRLDIGGPGHHSNHDIAALYAQAAGIPLRVSQLPAPLARAMSTLAQPFHPGLARVLRMLSLPDTAFDEHFHAAAELQHRFGLPLTTVEDFVQQRVRQARSPGATTT
jgi:uncharacterized protein YbjT (DUF2867 family)